MRELLKLKTVFSRIYSKYEGYINPVLKLIFAFVIISILNSRLGYMERIDNVVITLVLSLVCSFLPLTATAVVAGAVLLLHFYALGMEYALVAVVMLALMLLLYIRFVPGETLVLLVTPVLFLINIPYLVPLVMGIIGSPLSVVSVSFGVIIAFLTTRVSGMDVSAATEEGSLITGVKDLVDGIIHNKGMFLVIAAFAATLILVYVIRRRAIPYARLIATGVGVVFQIMILLVGKSAVELELSTAGIILGTILGGAISYIFQIFDYRLDYSKTESLQFEDDEYYYYVKAVPKISFVSAAGVEKKSSYDGEVMPSRSAGARQPQNRTSNTRQPQGTQNTRSRQNPTGTQRTPGRQSSPGTQGVRGRQTSGGVQETRSGQGPRTINTAARARAAANNDSMGSKSDLQDTNRK